jgi:predicted DNA-binding protein (MmcQ/YjbR family)
MHLEALRSFCLSLPHASEKMAWETHICFTVGEKIFCISTVEPANPTKMTFKCTPEIFAELIEQQDVIPAPHLARNHWVSLTTWDAIPAAELKEHLRNSYQLVWDKLPKRLRNELHSKVRSTKVKGQRSK